MSSADLVELVHSLQTQLAGRGAGAFRTLELAFDINDKDRNGTFDFAEIEAILAKSGLFLKVTPNETNEEGEGEELSGEARWTCLLHASKSCAACCTSAILLLCV